MGPSAKVGRIDDEYADDEEPGEEAWDSVFDVEVPIRYGTDDHEALWARCAPRGLRCILRCSTSYGAL